MGTNSYWARRAIEREDEWNKKRNDIAKYYDKNLDDKKYKSWPLNMKGPPNGYKQTLNNFTESSPQTTD
jgi:hypothetical protein